MEKKKFRISGKLIFNLAVVAISIYLIIYFFVSEELAPAIRDAWIENNVYGSDHCPVGLELAIA